MILLHRLFTSNGWQRSILTVAILAGQFGIASVLAADKSGVSANTISLPSGPGSIEGLGESFQPALNTGTAKYGVSLKLPPGTAGHAPGVGLSYEGGAGNGPVGFGWGLPVAFVQRQCDKGIPRYLDDSHNGIDDDDDGVTDEPDEVDVFVNEQKEELVPTTDGYYFCKNEGAFIRYRRNGDSWEATLPNGNRLQFGLTPEGRLQQATDGRVFAWLLEQSTDLRGNTILYSYRSFPGDQNVNQKYLAGIAYGPGPPPWTHFQFVTFEYEDRTDWFEDCRSGFVVRTAKRLKAVVIGTQGPALAGHLAGDFNHDGQADNLVRKYDLAYFEYAGTNSHWSLLARILPVGADGASSLPASTFQYSVCNPADVISASTGEIGGTNEPPFVMDNELVDLVDLNGDGLPDILKTEFEGGAHTGFLNQGELATDNSRVISWSAGTEIASADGLAWNVNLQSRAEVAHLADMDGDGLADLVFRSAADEVYYFANSGRLGWGPRQGMSVQDFTPPSPFGHPEVRTADVDFDKRIDLVQSLEVGTGADYRIWFNRGRQTYSSSRTVPQTSGFLFSKPGVQIADFNGDRVPDIVQLRPTTVMVTAGLGHGQFADPMTVAIPDLVLGDSQVAQAKLQDITGDGLADLVIERAEPGELWYWINLGNYTLSSRKRITGMPTGLGLNPAIRWADLNGNGTTDLIYADSASNPRLRAIDIGRLIGCVPRPNILTRIENGLGRVTTIQYQPSTAFALEDSATGHAWPDVMPFPVSVVASVTNSDSLGHSYSTHYRYHNGYYDAEEKEFRGFARVEVIEEGDVSAPTLVTRSHFDTGRDFEAMKGKLRRLTAEQEDGKTFWDETTTWTSPPKTLLTGTNGQTVTFVHPTARTRRISELGQGTERVLESEFSYDQYGNPTRQADYGIVADGDRSAFDDERVSITEYALNVAAWIVHAPKRQEIQDERGVVVSRVEHFYDDETFSGANFGEVTRGEMTLSRAWIDPADPAALVNSARTKYDRYGNPVWMLDPLAIAPGGIPDPSQGHAREIAYDDQFHAYPIRETIHLGQGSAPLVVEAEYDAGFGTVTASTDLNGHLTRYGYDAFARLIHLLKPGDDPAYPTVEYGYFPAQPYRDSGLVNFVETRLLDRTPGSAGFNKRDHYFIARQFTDGLGRKLLSKQEAENDPQTGAPRVVVSGAVQFNARSAAARALNPFYSLSGGTDLEALLAFEDISAPGWKGLFHDRGQLVALDLASAHQTATRYDATLRPLETIHPDGANARTVFEPLVTKAYDENDADPASPHADTPHVLFQDGLGRHVHTDEIVRLNDDGTPSAELRTWTTTYQYDLNDQLTRITDSQGNVKRLQYDALKRKTFMDDPDRGQTTYLYDVASNLIRVTDDPGTTNEQVTFYSYDGANRVLSQDSLDQGRFDLPSHRHPDVAYHYDAPSSFYPAAQNLKGQLAWVEDLSGAEFHSFDARGNPEWKVKRIASREGPRDFRTAFNYDVQDRLTEFTYPDETVITHVYNEGNTLAAIPGYLDAMTYLPSGQVQTERLSNGIVTEHAYNSRLWQVRLTTQRAGATPLQDYTYRFDPTGNILEIQDAIGPDDAPGSADQVFDYDCLDRLTRAQSPAYGALNYRYNPTGNLIHQRADNGDPRVDLGDYRYGRRVDVDGAGPHAVKETAGGTRGPLSIVYDANGNYRRRNEVEYAFDFQDRLVRARAPPQPDREGFTAEYRYDFQGQRVLKRVSSGGATNETLYAGPEFEIRSDRHLKYVFAGGRRLAQIETKEFRSPLAAGWNLVAVPVEPRDSRLTSVLSSAAGSWSAAAFYDKTSGSWTAIQKGSPETESLTAHAGDAFWLLLDQRTEFRLVGSMPDSLPLDLKAGWNLFATFIDDTIHFELLANPANNGVVIWLYDSTSKAWHSYANNAPEFLDTLNSLEPGKAYWVHAESPFTIRRPPTAAPTLAIYHPDHLGSANFVTDASGQIAETTEFYPFGVERYNKQTNGLITAYRYTGKEQDDETRLLCYGARYYDAVLGRFVSSDPLYAELDVLPEEKSGILLSNPQQFSLYSYVLNNPIRFNDPTGNDGNSVTDSAWEFVNRSPIEEQYGQLVAGREHLEREAQTSWQWAQRTGRWSLYGDAARMAALGQVARALETVHDATLRPLGLALTLFGGRMAEEASAAVVGALERRAAVHAATRAARSGVLADANYAQRTFSQTFSSEGAFAGRTVEDVAAALRSGQMGAADVPIEYIVRDGNTLILNTRSAQALEQAGIPRAQWNAVNATGDAAAEARLTGQLQRNGLTSQGTPTVTPGRR
ncbi:MAG: toxin TcdB middle/N-terminal domain-containing protein [Verrucomicrobiia bacterium]